MIGYRQSLLRVRTIDKRPGVDVVSGLKATWAGRFYTVHLKRYAFIRLLTIWTWRHGYPLYVKFTYPFNIWRKSRGAWGWRDLITLNNFSKTKGIPTYKLADAAFVETPQPKVYPTSEQSLLVAPHEGFEFPEIYVAPISNAMVYGGTNLILAEDEVICHDLYDFERDYTSEELNGRTLINPKSMRIRWLLHDDSPEPIPIAATFVDACALNYAHWLTEVLPRIVLFCAAEQFRGVPIVVNGGLHKNIMESLFLVVGTEREIITLPIGRALVVQKLYTTSVVGYVPFGQRTRNLFGYSHGRFSLWAFEKLRDRLHEAMGQQAEDDGPEKILLLRNSGTRKVTNAPELEKLLTADGYVIVEPEKLSFLEQIMIFNNAKWVVSPTGAALANAIFCKPGTNVTVLMGKHKEMIYRYWNNLLSPLGIRVNYVIGTIIENHHLGIHGDFVVDIECINDFLKDIENR